MLRPWKVTTPSVRAVGTSSFIRFIERSTVDFPHPDGPISAVMRRVPKFIDMSRTAWNAA